MKIDGQYLKKVREARGYSQRELAELTGISVATLNKWEVLPTANPFPSKLSKVAQVLEINIEKLVYNEHSEIELDFSQNEELNFDVANVFNVLSELFIMNRKCDQELIQNIKKQLIEWKINNR